MVVDDKIVEPAIEAIVKSALRARLATAISF